MLIIDGHKNIIMLENAEDPVPIDSIWVLDMNISGGGTDFTLTTFKSKEEIFSNTIIMRVAGFDFAVPAKWHVLVADPDNTQVDCIEIRKIAGKDFYALVYGPDMYKPQYHVIQLMDYRISHKHVFPVLPKSQMLCHPIGPNAWINISPSNGFGKYIKEASVGDLI